MEPAATPVGVIQSGRVPGQCVLSKFHAIIDLAVFGAKIWVVVNIDARCGEMLYECK